MNFNLRHYKEARRGSEPPQVFTRPYFRQERDVYDTTRSPNDGKGDKLTTPGSEGLPGQPGDMSAPAFGTRGRDGSPEPDDFSEFGSRDDRNIRDPNKKLPRDSDPPNPFASDFLGSQDTQYGSGQDTDYGQAQHDGTNRERSDSALSMENTVQRQLGEGGELDRKPAITNMPSGGSYNSLLENDDTPLGRIRRVQRR